MFNRKNRSVYIGNDLKRFNQIRDALDTAGISYDYKVGSHQNQFLAPGRGTIRGNFGSLGTDLEKSYEYEIKVSAQDEETVQKLVEKMMNM